MNCPHCNQSIASPADGNRCPHCHASLDALPIDADQRSLAQTVEVAPKKRIDVGVFNKLVEASLGDSPTGAEPTGSNLPPGGSATPVGNWPDDETVCFESDTAGPHQADEHDTPSPAADRTEAVVPDSAHQQLEDHEGATIDFQSPSHATEMFGLPSDFSPGMQVNAGTGNLVGPDDLALRRFVIQPRSEKPVKPIDYIVLKMAGAGGMGLVSRARQGSLNRDVAIKQMRPEIKEQSEERKKFVTEAVITGELEHPHIVPIHDLGLAEDGELFYAMKFVEGSEWKKELPNLSEAENIDVLLKVADAISFAHSRNIIHRDLKPGNILLGKFGEVLVMDWGLAARLDAPEGFPPAGTPIYMAPEMAIDFLQFTQSQLLRKFAAGHQSAPNTKATVGKHSDIYLLGALLFQIVTKKPPHSGRNGKECIQNAARNGIVKTTIESELLDIAYKAMATDPQDRYATVADFQHALRSYKSHVESITLAERADSDAQAAEQLRGNGKQNAKQMYDLFSSARYGFRNALNIWSENERAQVRLRETEQLFAETAYANDDFDLALSLLDRDNPDQQALHEKVTRSAQERTQRLTKLRRLRRTLFAVVSLALIGMSVLAAKLYRQYAEIVGLTGDKEQLAIEKASLSGDISALNTARADLETSVQGLNREVEAVTADKAQAIADLEKAGKAIVKAEAERQAAIAAQQNAVKIATASRGEAAKSEYRAAFQSAIAGLLDGGPKKGWDHLQAIAAAPPGEADWEWKRLSHLANWGRSATRIGGASESIPFLRSSATGDRLITGGNKNDTAVIKVWDTSRPTPVEVLRFDAPAAAVKSVAISRDGRWAAAGLDRQGANVLVWNVAAGSRAPEFEVSGNGVPTALAFSATRPELAVGNSTGNVVLWNLAGRQPQLLQRYNGQVWGTVHSIAFSDDGKFLATAGAGNRINLYQPAADSSSVWPVNLELSSNAPVVYSLAFWPGDSSRLVCGCSDGALYLCELTPQELAESLAEGDWLSSQIIPLGRHRDAAAVRDLAFAGDGKTMISSGDDQFVNLWNLERFRDATTAQLRFARRIHDAPVAACALSGDSRWAYSVDDSGVGFRWELDVADDFVTIPPNHGGDGADYRPVRAIGVEQAANARQQRVVTADGAGFARVVVGNAPPALSDIYLGHFNHAGMVAQYAEGATPQLITRTPDGTACTWNLDTGKLERSVNLFDRPGSAHAHFLAATPDARYLVGVANLGEGEEPRLGSLWETATGKQTGLSINDHAITALGLANVDAQGRPRLLVGQKFGQLLLWNGGDAWQGIGGGGNAPHRGAITAIAVHPGEFAYVADLAITSESSRFVSKWSLREATPTYTGISYELPIEGSANNLRLRLSKDGSTLTIIQADDTGRISGLSVLSTRDSQPLGSQPTSTAGNAGLLDVAISPRGQTVLAVSDNNTLQVWDASSKQWRPHRTAKNLQAAAAALGRNRGIGKLRRIEFIDDQRLLAYGDGFALESKLDTGELVRCVQSRAPLEVAALLPGQQEQVATVAADGRYCRWQRATSESDYQLVDQQFLTKLGHVRAVSAPTSGSALVAVTELGGDSTALGLIELATGKRTPFESVRGRIAAMNWASAEPRFAIASTDDRGNHVLIFEARASGTPQQIADISINSPNPVSGIALDRAGTRVAICSGDTIHFATQSDWNQVQPVQFAGHDLTAAAFSRSGHRLAIGSENGQIALRVVEETGGSAPIGRMVMTLSGHDAAITRLEFAALGSSENEVLLSGDVHGKSLVHLATGEAPTGEPAPPTESAADFAP